MFFSTPQSIGLSLGKDQATASGAQRGSFVLEWAKPIYQHRSFRGDRQQMAQDLSSQFRAAGLHRGSIHLTLPDPLFDVRIFSAKEIPKKKEHLQLWVHHQMAKFLDEDPSKIQTASQVLRTSPDPLCLVFSAQRSLLDEITNIFQQAELDLSSLRPEGIQTFNYFHDQLPKVPTFAFCLQPDSWSMIFWDQNLLPIVLRSYWNKEGEQNLAQEMLQSYKAMMAQYPHLQPQRHLWFSHSNSPLPRLLENALPGWESFPPLVLQDAKLIRSVLARGDA